MTTPEAGTAPSPIPARAPDARRRAFSLLEVLAAVMILSIWYMIIANAAVVGLRSEGESRRRIEAGRIADRKLAQIEIQALSGNIPEQGNECERVDEYERCWSVGPFTVFAAAPQAEDGAEPRQAKSLHEFVMMHTPGAGRLIVSIMVRVSWPEGRAMRHAVRSTYVFDEVEAAKIYEQDKSAEDEEDETSEDERDGAPGSDGSDAEEAGR